MLNLVRLTTNVTIGDKFAEIHVDAGQTLEYYQNQERDCEIRVDTKHVLEYYCQSGEGNCEGLCFHAQ